jgi:hypothetical protein
MKASPMESSIGGVSMRRSAPGWLRTRPKVGLAAPGSTVPSDRRTVKLRGGGKRLSIRETVRPTKGLVLDSGSDWDMVTSNGIRWPHFTSAEKFLLPAVSNRPSGPDGRQVPWRARALASVVRSVVLLRLHRGRIRRAGRRKHTVKRQPGAPACHPRPRARRLDDLWSVAVRVRS